MEIKTTKRTIEVEDRIYVAEDGKEFATEKDCIDYEKDLEYAQLEAKAENFEIKELEDTYPLDTDGMYISENHSFHWYKVNNETEHRVINNLYGGVIDKPETFPEIICIESDGYYDDAWTYFLSNMKKDTVDFWKRHGFNVEFKAL